jgi:ubiquinone biosynthesis protein
MVPESLIPTPLIDPTEREPVAVRQVVPPTRWRSWGVVSRWTRWLAGEVWYRIIGSHDAVSRGRRLRAVLEDLGGIWIKVGQLLSLRIDLLSLEVCQELARLQDRAYGFPGAIACDIVATELGQPVHAVFSEFDATPLAAASIGQVHRARLRNGDAVAVKVQRPHVRESLAAELGFIRIVATLLDRLHIARFMRWESMRWELEAILSEELDYLHEASAMERMQATLPRHGLYVPQVYPEWSTRQVLVMEFVTGVLMADYIATVHANPGRVRAWERENNIDQQRVNRRFSRSILRQVIEDNLYHGDLHPGNIILLRDSRVALLDFGSVGFTEREYLEKFRLFMTAMASQEYERAADMALLLGAPMPPIDLGSVRAEIVRALEQWGLRTSIPGLPYPLKSVDAVNVAINRIFFEHRLAFEWAFLRIRRAFATMDATAMHLFPEADYSEVTRAYFRGAARRRITASVTQPAPSRVVDEDSLAQLAEFGQLALEIERRRLRVVQTTLTGSAGLVVAVATFAVPLAVAGVYGAALALTSQHGPDWARPIATVLSAGLIARAPALDWQIWIGVCACGWIVARTAAGLRTGFLAASQRGLS